VLDGFLRKREVIKISGLGYTSFHNELNAGRFPPADTYLGTRTPVWLESTVRRWVQEKVTEYKQKVA
jgi:predicted DNA-binding transcriptional regulator AlpA